MTIFAPIGPQPPHEVGNVYFPDGSSDYFELFTEDAEWTEARGRLGAFKIHAWQARVFFSDEEIRTMVGFLDEHDLPLIMESEPLNPPTTCQHTESFEGPNEIQTARKIRMNGGTIAAVAIEQPYSFGHLLDGEGACQYSVERIIEEVTAWVTSMRRIFPDVQVGSIEGLWQSPRTTPEDMAIWLDAYEEAMGEPFAFLHIDVDWTGNDWQSVLLGIEEVADERGVPFGVIYNGWPAEDSAEWLQLAIARATEFEQIAGGTPDHVVFQSWNDKPDLVLPETDPGAFTHLINRYDGIRTVIPAPAFDPASREIIGVVGSTAGDPVSGQSVNASITPTDGAPQGASIERIVPDGATEALLLVRVNAEDAGSGTLDATIFETSYREGDHGENRIPNGDFSAGDQYFGYSASDGVVRFRASDRTGEPALVLAAAAGDEVFINGEVFTVTPGESYQFDVVLGAVAAAEPTSGTIGIAFLADGVEVARHMMRIEPQEVALGADTTDAGGAYRIPIGDLGPGAYIVNVRTPGSVGVWPSAWTGHLEITP